MKNSSNWIFGIVFTGIFILSACSPGVPQITSTLEQPAVTNEPITSPLSPVDAVENTEEPVASSWGLEVVAQGLEIPWGIVFPSENRILVSERTGAIREIVDGILSPNPVYVFEEVRARDEAGLMALTLHPDYINNGFIYACYTASGSGANIITRVSRLADEGDLLTFDRVILDNMPAARFHAGCRVQFGPDGMLYISTGDALNTALPQNPDSLAGKILRLTAEGDIPADNPLPSSPVYSLGHRNPQGLAWDIENDRMYATEHGPSTFDGPPGGDEINLIVPGGNYGWPLGSHDDVPQGTIGPLIQFTPAEAPASALFYDNDALPFFKGSLFFGALRGEGLMRVTFIENEDGELSVAQAEKIIDDVGRVRDVSIGPDGSIYFSTSNRDGRGNVRDGDDQIYRIFPVYN
jgi:glucose/arabinose dehydrogenase